MKRFSLLAAMVILMAAITAVAAPKPDTANVPAFPGTLRECTLRLRCLL